MSDWQQYKLGSICEVGDGAHAKVKRQNSGILYLTSKNLGPGYLKLNNVDYISEEDYKKLFQESSRAISRLISGDILIGIIGTFGNAYLYKENDRFGISSSVGIIRPDKAILNPRFLYYLVTGEDFKNTHDAYKGGSVQGYTNIPTIKSLPISIPPLPEQKAIASVLSSLDDKIDLLHRQNKTLEAIAETLFRQWFIEEAQADWEEGNLGNEFDFTMGQSPSGSSFNEEGIGVPMFQGNADFGFRFPDERVYTTEPTRFAKQFDTLISVRAPVGAQNMAHKECCIGRGVAAFRYKRNSHFYTYTYFKLRSLMEDIKKFNDEGTVFGSISKSDFEVLAVTIPPNELIEKYEQEVSPVNDKVIANCEQIRTLEKLRDTLLPKLMSGEVRVAS